MGVLVDLNSRLGLVKNVGIERLRWRDNWHADGDYSAGDIVARAGSLYICAVEHILAPAASPPSQPWRYFASGGSAEPMPGSAIIDAIDAILGTGWRTTDPTLGLSRNAVSITLTVDDVPIVFPGATDEPAGLFSAEDKAKLDEL